MKSPHEIASRLETHFGGKLSLTIVGQGPRSHLVTDREHLLPVLAFLKNDPELSFDVLTDLTAVDHMHLTPPDLGTARFAVVYQLYSSARGHRVRLAARVPGADLVLPTATRLWPAARWAEREVFDLFGIEFDDHPDLRRLLLPEAYPGFPLRKDEPVDGTARRETFVASLRNPTTEREPARVALESIDRS